MIVSDCHFWSCYFSKQKVSEKKTHTATHNRGWAAITTPQFKCSLENCDSVHANRFKSEPQRAVTANKKNNKRTNSTKVWQPSEEASWCFRSQQKQTHFYLKHSIPRIKSDQGCDVIKLLFITAKCHYCKYWRSLGGCCLTGTSFEQCLCPPLV